MYNGYADQDAFHAAMQAEWARRLSTEEGRAEHARTYGPGTRSHAGCDHAYGYCALTGDNVWRNE